MRLHLWKDPLFKLFCWKWTSCAQGCFNYKYPLCKIKSCPMQITKGVTKVWRIATGMEVKP